MYLTNLSTFKSKLNWFGGTWYGVKEFLNQNNLDAIELILYGDYDLMEIPSGLVKGLHMRYWPYWLDFWYKDDEALKRNLREEKNIEHYYGFKDRKGMVDYYKSELKAAKELGCEYMVFHVSHASFEEIFTKKFRYSDEEVLKASSELINMIFEDEDCDIEILFENLWWPGLNFMNPKLTKEFFESIKYKNKGFMLDLSHLMICNTNLKNLKEASDYIIDTVNELGEMKEYIKGVHINKSLSGEYMKKCHLKRGKEAEEIEDFGELFSHMISHISKIDMHLPYDDESIKDILKAVKPKYKVYELLTKDLKELEKNIQIQNKMIGNFQKI